MSEGKSFHIHAPATGKARPPTVEVHESFAIRIGKHKLSYLPTYLLTVQ